MPLIISSVDFCVTLVFHLRPVMYRDGTGPAVFSHDVRHSLVQPWRLLRGRNLQINFDHVARGNLRSLYVDQFVFPWIALTPAFLALGCISPQFGIQYERRTLLFGSQRFRPQLISILPQPREIDGTRRHRPPSSVARVRCQVKAWVDGGKQHARPRLIDPEMPIGRSGAIHRTRRECLDLVFVRPPETLQLGDFIEPHALQQFLLALFAAIQDSLIGKILSPRHDLDCRTLARPFHSIESNYLIEFTSWL